MSRSVDVWARWLAYELQLELRAEMGQAKSDI